MVLLPFDEFVVDLDEDSGLEPAVFGVAGVEVYGAVVVEGVDFGDEEVVLGEDVAHVQLVVLVLFAVLREVGGV